MASEETDVVVLGLGVGGEAAAGRLAEAGLHVTGVEDRLVGGECPYWACVPTKMMIRSADLVAEARRVPGMAGAASVTPDWAPVARRIREEATDSWDDKVAVDRFTGQGGHFLRGRGRITAAGEVTVDTAEGSRVLRARRGIVLATGSAPTVPPIPGLDGTPYWTNREAVKAEHVPASLVVLGGGAVGVEFAQVFARFGTRVSVVEAADRLLPAEEPEAGALVAEVFAHDDITVRTNAKAQRIDHEGERFTVRVGGEPADSGGGSPGTPGALTAERLLVATGRHTSLQSLGVAVLGLDADAKALHVDERMRAADNVWAIGDVTGAGPFTHVAMYQADIAVRDILGAGGPGADYRALPRVTFTDPEVGAVGLTEEQARAQGIEVRTGAAQVPSTARGWIHKAGNDGFIKLVADAGRGVLVGATSAGPVGGEVLSALVVAVHAEVPVDRLASMMYAYPTFHRGIEDAVRNLTATK